jgi:hypothetical protein
LRVEGLGLRVEGVGCGEYGCKLLLMVYGLEFMVEGVERRVWVCWRV